MKIDDIFEAMTDIDDKFIEAARPIEHDSPMIAVPAPRRALWKTLVPAAAFVAVVAAAGVVGVKYLRGREPLIIQPSSSLASLKEYWYPEEAKYVVSNDIGHLGFGYQIADNGLSMYDASADYAESYDALAKRSDLIVSGMFIDDIHQTSDSEEILGVGDDDYMMSYNWFEVSGVIKGDIEEGSILTIGQNSTINSANGEDDKYNVYTCDQLSPMFNGDKWIYFLKQEENGTFSPVNGPQGRYPLPNSTNRLISSDGENPNVDEYFTYENAAPARDEIYAKVLELLAEVAPKIEQIGVQDEVRSFGMEEFPGYDFKVSRSVVWADYFGEYGDIMDILVFDTPDSGRFENLILADLNGDGKRELCATISCNGRRSAVVRDFENSVTYMLRGNKGKEYILSVDDGVLNVHHSIIGFDTVATSSEPLTFDMLVKEITYDTDAAFTEAVLDVNHTFTLPDFEGFEFTLDTSYEYPQFSFRWGSSSSANHVNNVYFSDLDGDGQREIILNCPFGDLGWIRIYGFMDNGEIGEAVYYENGGCRLVKADGKLNYKNESGEIPFEFSRSELKPMFEQKYSIELLDWDHQLIYDDIVPVSGIFNIRIEDRRLIITFNGETAFTSARDLGELFTIPDAENNRLIFVYSNETNDCIDAFSLSNHPEKLVCLNDANVVNAAPTDVNDMVIYFEDGRSVSINNILSCFETTDNS